MSKIVSSSESRSKNVPITQPTIQQLRTLSDRAASLYELISANTDDHFCVRLTDKKICELLGLQPKELRFSMMELEDHGLVRVAGLYTLPGTPD